MARETVAAREARLFEEENQRKLIAQAADLGDGDGGEVDPVAEILANLTESGDIEITVHEVDGRKTPYLFGFSPGDYSSRELRDFLLGEYGTGEYSVQVREGGRFVAKRTISVKGRKSAPAPVQNQQQGQPGDIAGMLASMQQQTRDLILTMQVESSKQQVELMRTMMERAQAPQLDVVSLLATAQKMFQQKDNSVDLLLKGIELSQSLKGENTGDSGGLSNVIQTMGAPLVEMARAAMAQQHRVGMAGAESLPPPENQNYNGAVSQESEQMALMGQLRGQAIASAVKSFIKAAERGSDPATYAQLFVDQYGDDVADDLITEDAEYEKLFALVPEAGLHREWFDKVRAGVISILFEDEDNATH